MPIKETHSVTSGTAEEKDNLPARKFLLPPNLVHPKGFELTLQDEELIRVMEPLYAASIPESFSPLCTLDWFILVHGDKPLDKYGSAFSVNKNRLGKILREEGYKIGRIVKQDHDGKHIPYFYISALTSAEIEELNKSNLTDPDKRPYKEYPKSPHILELEEKKREEINQALTIQVVYCLNNRGSLDSLQKPRAIIEEACESKGLDIYALIGCNQAGYLSENPAIYYVSGIFETLILESGKRFRVGRDFNQGLPGIDQERL